MRRIIIPIIILLGISSYSHASIELDSSGLYGDHFSLQGALEMFKSSESLEAFETKINEENSYINNLDLNEDGEIDYIRVVDNMDNDVHAIVLQAVVSGSESQDVAVIEVEKNGAESATLQIVGDELLYGSNMYIEPFDVEGTSEGPGPNANYELSRVVVNVWFWPSVRYIYAPRYRVWVSPWGWRSYPKLWKPWKPRSYHWHFHKRKHYRHHYRHAKVHHVHKAHKVYTPHRKSSVRVKQRTITRVNNNGKIKQSKKTVVKKGDKKIVRKKTKIKKGDKVVVKKKTKIKTKKRKTVKKTKKVKKRK